VVVRFELQVLSELGFGLDLERCVATGSSGDLVYVSPKSGRAVSRSAGEPWADRMLRLPAFLRERDAKPVGTDIAAGFALTGYFPNGTRGGGACYGAGRGARVFYRGVKPRAAERRLVPPPNEDPRRSTDGAIIAVAAVI